MLRWFLLCAACAGCAPSPPVLLWHLRGLEQLAVRASVARAAACPVAPAAAPPRCEELRGCLLHVQASAHRCNCAIKQGATAADAEYSAAARGCVEESTAAQALCAPLLPKEPAHGGR
jgi:hypothetical protein